MTTSTSSPPRPWRPPSTTPKQRADIVSAAFDEIRVKDKIIVSATLARPEYVALVATSEAAQAEGLSWRPRTAPSTQQQRSVLDYYLEVG